MEYAVLGGRDQAVAAAYRCGDHAMQQIADYFGVHYAPVSQAVRRQGV
ncbi:MAG TPA: hypothetical protein VFA48_03155 [Gammaproteobacteria bacterium]|nr:hypothetical protein [Gammaproteobacteria bacterium]